MVNNKDGVSQRKLAGHFQCTHSYVNRVIKSMGIQKYKKQKIPDRSDQQKSIERSVQRFTVNTEIENGFWTMRVILQNSFHYQWKWPISTTILKTIGCVKKKLNVIRMFDIIENLKFWGVFRYLRKNVHLFKVQNERIHSDSWQISLNSTHAHFVEFNDLARQ